VPRVRLVTEQQREQIGEVLDLGSGGGIECRLSARRVGPTGLAYGLEPRRSVAHQTRPNAPSSG
jgi:arsenite methyltransferase